MQEKAQVTYYRDTKQILVSENLKLDDYSVVIYPTPECGSVLFWGCLSLFTSGNPNVLHAHATCGETGTNVSQVLLMGETNIDPTACLLHDAKTLPAFEQRGLSRLLRTALMHTGAKKFKKDKMICYMDEDNDKSIKARFFLSKIAEPNQLSTEFIHTTIDITKAKISVSRDIRTLLVESDMSIPASKSEQEKIMNLYV
jgi:hypothetical protein